MDFNFLAAANGITTKYLNQTASTANTLSRNNELKGKFGEDFDKAYDEMQATRLLNTNMRESYEATHQNDFKAHASRLGYSIDNRVIDMLNVQLTDQMNSQVNIAMDNAIKNF